MTCSSNDLLYFKWGNYKKKGGYLHLIKQAFNQHRFVNFFSQVRYSDTLVVSDR